MRIAILFLANNERKQILMIKIDFVVLKIFTLGSNTISHMNQFELKSIKVTPKYAFSWIWLVLKLFCFMLPC